MMKYSSGQDPGELYRSEGRHKKYDDDNLIIREDNFQHSQCHMSKSDDPPESPPPLDSPELLLPPNIEPTTLCAIEEPTPNAKPCATIPPRPLIMPGSGPAGAILRLLSAGLGAPRAVVSSVVWFQKYVCPLALSRTSTHGSVDLVAVGPSVCSILT